MRWQAFEAGAAWPRGEKLTVTAMASTASVAEENFMVYWAGNLYSGGPGPVLSQSFGVRHVPRRGLLCDVWRGGGALICSISRKAIFFDGTTASMTFLSTRWRR